MGFSLTVIRRSAAELLAAAVLELYPTAQLLGGAVTWDGFYYDFLWDKAPDLSAIEKRFQEIIHERRPIRSLEMVGPNAAELLRHRSQPRAAARLRGVVGIVDLFQMGEFYDLCLAPHVESADQIKHSALLSLEGGRIIGTACADFASLKEAIKAAKRAQKQTVEEWRTLEPLPGLKLLSPAGAALREALRTWWVDQHRRDGFEILSTPDTPGYARTALHVLILNGSASVEADFPVRYAEWGSAGDSAHLFCTPSQLIPELISSLQFIAAAITLFELKYRLFVDGVDAPPGVTHAAWKGAHEALLKALKRAGLTAEGEPPEANSEGPAVYFRLQDRSGQGWSGPRLTVNLLLPGLIERTLFSPLEEGERMLASHFAGGFPLWLAPEQMRVLPVDERQQGTAQELARQLRRLGYRVGTAMSNQTLASRLKGALEQRVPYSLVVGEREAREKSVTLRTPEESGSVTLPVEAFIARLEEEMVKQNRQIGNPVESQ